MSIINTLSFILKHPLTRDSRFEALSRFVKWQIACRMIKGPLVIDWINGAKFYAVKGESGVTGNIYVGLHEFADMAYLLHVLDSQDLFVDTGANAGSYTILATAVVGARAYAFEPAPGTYNRLVENLRLNHVETRVKSMNAGAGSASGHALFVSNLDTTNHVLSADTVDANAIRVEIVTLDHVLANEEPAMIKIDVEGYELPVLEGAINILKKPSLHTVILELNGSGSRYGYAESSIVGLMNEYGFAAYTYNPQDRTLSKSSGYNKDGNTLFIRNVALVMDKINTSPRIYIYGKQI